MELRAFRYRLRMRPIHLGGRLYTEREGLVLCDARTQRHWGEAAPLPPFSRESLNDVIDEWRAGSEFSLPSLRCALDAIEQSIARADRCTEFSSTVVPVNGLISGSASEMLAAARQFAGGPHRAVKMKVGPRVGSIEQCAEIVRQVRAALRPDQTLRLDANRAWNLSEAMQFGKAIATAEIEYCEEPTETPDELELFWAETGVPYALDETLRETGNLHAFPNARALVVKPMVMGSREEIARLQQFAIPLVFSGTFESGIGTLHVAYMAHEFSPGTPTGIDSYSWLLEDLVAPRLDLRDGTLTPRPWSAIQYELLEELTR